MDRQHFLVGSSGQLKKKDQDEPDPFPFNRFTPESVQPHRHIEQPVKVFGALRQLIKVSLFERLGERTVK